MPINRKLLAAALLAASWGAALTSSLAAASAAIQPRTQDPYKAPGARDKECGQPACYAGDDGTKSCYICEYGKSTQHTVCVQKDSRQDRDYGVIQDRNKSKDQCPSVKQVKPKGDWQQN